MSEQRGRQATEHPERILVYALIAFLVQAVAVAALLILLL